MTINKKVFGSFRDPSGFLFFRDGVLYRQIDKQYQSNYRKLMDSGLYENLTSKNYLIEHEEIDNDAEHSVSRGYRVIKPKHIPFISYPYEWCFSQLKDAALLTLKIQKIAIEYGMSLKDASAYNIQFINSHPILIDTLSFEKYDKGQPWIAYKQFCQHFLSPLSLMSHTDIRLNQLLRIYTDGIPLDLTSRLLPAGTRINLSLLTHVHLHAKSQKLFSAKKMKLPSRTMSSTSLLGIIDSLEKAIGKMRWAPGETEWVNYYDETNYSVAAFEHKKKAINAFLDKINPEVVWDLGANDGTFSRLAACRGIQTISCDVDMSAVERNYLLSKDLNETHLLPLVLDLTNPSSGIGWSNRERNSFLDRGPADAVFALALIHHLAISNNLPFDKIADFFRTACEFLVIEFVPKNDSQVQRLLTTRKDIFPFYTQECFQKIFSGFFVIEDSVKIKESERTLYLMRKK